MLHCKPVENIIESFHKAVQFLTDPLRIEFLPPPAGTKVRGIEGCQNARAFTVLGLRLVNSAIHLPRARLLREHHIRLLGRVAFALGRQDILPLRNTNVAASQLRSVAKEQIDRS
jgi:hypothetical protein